MVYSVGEDGALTAQPINIFGNPRGAELAGANLLKDARNHRDNMARLGTYAILVCSHLHGAGPLPTRPQSS
jgi:hypothetical protein